jgi:reactive intermediate/imine deaminase
MPLTRHFVAAAPRPPAGVRYHHATQAGPFLYVTGQLPSDPADPAAPFPDGIEAQAQATFRNLDIIVAAAGYSWRDTVFVRIFLADFDRDYDGFNKVYHSVFSDDAATPSRTTVGVARLGRGALVEVDMVLYRDP